MFGHWQHLLDRSALTPHVCKVLNVHCVHKLMVLTDTDCNVLITLHIFPHSSKYTFELDYTHQFSLVCTEHAVNGNKNTRNYVRDYRITVLTQLICRLASQDHNYTFC